LPIGGKSLKDVLGIGHSHMAKKIGIIKEVGEKINGGLKKEEKGGST
jgi:hypothetical protein